MRQVPNGKRSRNRPGRNNNRPSNSRNQTYDSNGPEGRVRGTANQVYEKYLALGRDASSSGDRIVAENFFQHAEHYFRILSANGQQGPRPRPMNGFGNEFDDDESDNSDADNQPVRGQGPQPDVKADGPNGQASGQSPKGNGSRGEDPGQNRCETPAELAKAAQAKSDESKSDQKPGQRSPRGRKPRRNDDAGAEVAS